MGILEVSWSILCQSAAYILAGFAIAGVLHVWLARTSVTRFLAERSPRSVILATIVGAPLPLCSCSVLPTAITLRKRGASKGATLSFLISTPETSVTSILLTYALLGPLMMIARPIASIITALLAGFTENFVQKRWPDAPPPPQQQAAEGGGSGCCCSGKSGEPDAPAPRLRYRDGMRYAFVDLFDDIFHWVIIGVVAAAAIQALMPAVVFQTVFSGPITSMLLMVVLGVPLYICAEGSTPIAAAMIAKGVNPGAALVLLLVGPATNIGSVGALLRELGRRTIIIYLTTIVIVALVMGGLLNLLIERFELPLGVRAFGEPLLPQWARILGAVAFLALGLATARRKNYWGKLAGWLDGLLPVRVSPRGLLLAVIAIAIAAYFASGFFTVQPGQVGIVREFGAVTHSDLAPGLHYAWPVPISQIDRIPVRRVSRMALGFKPPDAGEDYDGAEWWSLVGDENMVDLKLAVHWGVDASNVLAYAYGVNDREQLVRSVTLGAMREVLGGSSIKRVFTDDRRALEDQIESLIAARLAAYDVGIRIDALRFLDSHAPPDVHDAFRSVASALEDKATRVHQAEARQARLIPVALGEAERLRAEAAGYDARTTAAAEGLADGFLELLAVYAESGEVTRERLHFEMLDQALLSVKKYIKALKQDEQVDIWLIDPGIGDRLPWQADADTK